jgi:SAM-dependent methyltransferase
MMNKRPDLINRSQKADADVQAFYDQCPYPAPVNNLKKFQQAWMDERKRKADFYLHWPWKPYSEEMTILVAGCGTSQAAKHAIKHPLSHVVGIDFSKTSVQYTQYLKQKYNLTNLDVQQIPIQNVTDLNKKFDKIISTGVLHHLSDPDEGLTALNGVLVDDGVMHLMVYAPYGRAGIYWIQEFCRQLNVSHADQDIIQLAETLTALPPHNPLAHLLANAPDFQRKDALADALLNPHDRAYSVPELFEYVERNGLKFGRWIRQAPYLPHCGAIAHTPLASRMMRQPAQMQYQLMELFRGNMLRHTFTAYKKEIDHSITPVFDHHQFLSHIPYRWPESLTIEERLPPGSAAVLINQAHTDTDLYLPITTEEKQFVDAIDGTQTIKQIIEKVIVNHSQKHRLENEQVIDLFIRLWRYDQIVFEIHKA